ncbi:MAG: UDP-3-O-[3-hydroxymyristoyl] N-acetylglucosamine deacetylase, partial [Candidatus Lindowbacteria bacterium]|nr:UDP-3-O-[3-hydroxymyristoyl] N-acetylglucosamine deacetylase [Candidatus Lindowbacteria bacterium]
MNQTTLAKEISISGGGLHTGLEINMVLKPTGPNKGITFIRTDLAESPELPVHLDFLVGTERETTLGRGEVTIHTVEHLLSACNSVGIDNLIVEIDGPEVPSLDGSAIEFLRAINKAGLKTLNAPKDMFRVREPIWVEDGDKQIVILPCIGFKVSYTIHFPDSGIKSQFMSIEITPESYEKEIASARTFCGAQEIEMLRNAGL